MPFALREEVGQSLALLQKGAREKGLQLSCHVSEGVPGRVVGDPLRLRQVLLNLAGNALKFTHAGSIKVVVKMVDETDADPLSLGAGEGDPTAGSQAERIGNDRVCVESDGVGGSPDEQRNVGSSSAPTDGRVSGGSEQWEADPEKRNGCTSNGLPDEATQRCDGANQTESRGPADGREDGGGSSSGNEAREGSEPWSEDDAGCGSGRGSSPVSPLRAGLPTRLVQVEVRDTGIGVPDEARNRIFKAFMQADSSTSRRYGEGSHRHTLGSPPRFSGCPTDVTMVLLVSQHAEVKRSCLGVVPESAGLGGNLSAFRAAPVVS